MFVGLKMLGLATALLATCLAAPMSNGATSGKAKSLSTDNGAATAPLTKATGMEESSVINNPQRKLTAPAAAAIAAEKKRSPLAEQSPKGAQGAIATTAVKRKRSARAGGAGVKARSLSDRLSRRKRIRRSLDLYDSDRNDKHYTYKDLEDLAALLSLLQQLNDDTDREESARVVLPVDEDVEDDDDDDDVVVIPVDSRVYDRPRRAYSPYGRGYYRPRRFYLEDQPEEVDDVVDENPPPQLILVETDEPDDDERYVYDTAGLSAEEVDRAELEDRLRRIVSQIAAASKRRRK